MVGDMNFRMFGKEGQPSLMLIPGLGVSYEIFVPLIRLLETEFCMIAVEIDGFTLGEKTKFTSVDDQAAQANEFIRRELGGKIDCIYGLSLGGKILSRMIERDEINASRIIMDAAPLLPLPRWLVGPLRHYQAFNVWTCFRFTGFWKAVFHSHYFDVLLEECRKVYPFGGRLAVLDGYKSVYSSKLESMSGKDVNFWYGTKEAIVARPQVEHLIRLCPNAHIEVFQGSNHGQLLVDHPEEVAMRLRHL